MSVLDIEDVLFELLMRTQPEEYSVLTQANKATLATAISRMGTTHKTRLRHAIYDRLLNRQDDGRLDIDNIATIRSIAQNGEMSYFTRLLNKYVATSNFWRDNRLIINTAVHRNEEYDELLNAVYAATFNSIRQQESQELTRQIRKNQRSRESEVNQCPTQ